VKPILVIVILATIACSAPRPEPGAQLVVRPSLQPMTLPDLANADAAVAERIRAQHASVTALGDATDEERGRAYGELAKLLMAANLLTDAEPALLNARALAPREMRWHYYLGHLYRLQHAPGKAIPSFEQARALQPGDVPTLVWLGRLYVEQGRPDAAAPLLEQALALQPRSAATLFELGRLALSRREFAQAADRLEAALREDAGAVQAHYPLAMAYRGLGRAGEAAAHLKQWKDVELTPADPLMADIGSLLGSAIEYEVRGTRALDRRDWKDAIASFRAGLERAPSDASLYLNLGTALFLSGETEQARSAFETAIRLSPGYARGHFALGLLEAERGRPDAAIDRFTAAVKYDPAFIDARFSLAELLRGAGRTEASLPHYLAIIKADPNSSQARFGYAMGLVRLGRHRDARDVLAEATRAHPDQPGLTHALGRLLASAPDPQARDGGQALRLLEPLSGQSNSSTIAESMAMALAENGRYPEAVRWQRDAMARAGREGGPAAAARLQDNLRLYEGRSPSRTPWRDDDPVFRPGVAGREGRSR
jgi:tetratricopeptide (TPR) repeat protein